MKRIIPCLLAFSLALAGIAAAAPIQTEEVLGDWYLQSIVLDELTTAASPTGADMRLQILPAGGAVIRVPGTDTSDTALAWKLSDNALILWRTDGGAEPQTFTLAGETLVTRDDLGQQLVFGREAIAALPLSPAVVSTQAAQFDGDWVGVRLYDGATLRPLASAGLAARLSIAGGKVKLRTVENGVETSYSGKAKLVNGVLTAALKSDDKKLKLELALRLTLRADGTLTYPLAAPMETCTVICERAVPEPEATE